MPLAFSGYESRATLRHVSSLSNTPLNKANKNQNRKITLNNKVANKKYQ